MGAVREGVECDIGVVEMSRVVVVIVIVVVVWKRARERSIYGG